MARKSTCVLLFLFLKNDDNNHSHDEQCSLNTLLRAKAAGRIETQEKQESLAMCQVVKI